MVCVLCLLRVGVGLFSEDPVSFRKMILETDLFSDWDFEEICSMYPELGSNE